MLPSSSDEKKGPPPESYQQSDIEHDASGATTGGVFNANDNEEFEVFKTTAGVNFRTVEWPRATVIFLKVIFAVGVLTIPTAMYDLGAVGGTLSVVGWGLLNTWAAVIQGDFRNNHRGCHGIADMAEVVGGPVVREITGALFIVAYVLLTGSGILGVSIAFNVFSGHAVCTNWFSFVAMILIIAAASFRKMSQVSLRNLFLMAKSFRRKIMGILHRRSQTTKKTSLTQKHPDRMANLGGLRLRLRRRLHRRRSRNPSRPPRRRAPNRRLRAWLLRHRAPDLLSRHSRHLLHLRLLRRNLGLPARHQRNARAPRLPQIPLPVHGDRHRVLHVFLFGRIPLLWTVGGGAFARVGGVDDQDYCVWGWVYWVVGFGVLVLARRGQIRLCKDSEEFGALAVRHVGALGHLARLHDWAGSDCVHLGSGDSDFQLLA
jgi:hypothetical protein